MNPSGIKIGVTDCGDFVFHIKDPKTGVEATSGVLTATKMLSLVALLLNELELLPKPMSKPN